MCTPCALWAMPQLELSCCLTPCPYGCSIAGHEMAWPTYMLPPPVLAQADAEEVEAARVLVPRQAIEYLSQQGVDFRPMWL